MSVRIIWWANRGRCPTKTTTKKTKRRKMRLEKKRMANAKKGGTKQMEINRLDFKMKLTPLAAK